MKQELTEKLAKLIDSASWKKSLKEEETLERIAAVGEVVTFAEQLGEENCELVMTHVAELLYSYQPASQSLHHMFASLRDKSANNQRANEQHSAYLRDVDSHINYRDVAQRFDQERTWILSGIAGSEARKADALSAIAEALAKIAEKMR